MTGERAGPGVIPSADTPGTNVVLSVDVGPCAGSGTSKPEKPTGGQGFVGPTGNDFRGLRPSITTGGVRVCGALTTRGTLCENPYLTQFGLCSEHSTQIELGEAGTISNEGSGVTVCGIGGASDGCGRTMGHNGRDHVAHMAQSKEKQTNTGDDILRDVFGVDVDSEVKKENPHVCGASAQNGRICRNPNFARFGLCSLHSFRGEAEGSSAVASSSAETATDKESTAMTDVDEAHKGAQENVAPVEVEAKGKGMEKDGGDAVVGCSVRGLGSNDDEGMVKMEKTDFREAVGVDEGKKRKAEGGVGAGKRARVDYHSPVNKDSMSLELEGPERVSPDSPERPTGTGSQEEPHSLAGSIVEFVRNNFYFNPVRRVFGYFQSKIAGP